MIARFVRWLGVPLSEAGSLLELVLGPIPEFSGDWHPLDDDQ